MRICDRCVETELSSRLSCDIFSPTSNELGVASSFKRDVYHVIYDFRRVLDDGNLTNADDSSVWNLHSHNGRHQLRSCDYVVSSCNQYVGLLFYAWMVQKFVVEERNLFQMPQHNIKATHYPHGHSRSQQRVVF